MRNLKKILALVLALVMSLSLMATAGAASFPDVDDSNPYATAIDVLDQLKVFQGFEDGTFKPTDTLNRAQAAVLVYRIATGDVEGKYVDNYTYMAQSKFTDLDGYNWAKGYINYCQNAGIVVGTDATHFNPGGKVTGYQLLVMLLRTLGYGKAGEFADPKGWELQTASIAEREGILKNVTGGDFGAPAPRQMVAEILFQGLLTETVTYSALTSGGYTKTGETLGKKNLGLEKIEGIVVANEYANLDAGKTLGSGKTLLRTETKDYTLNVTSGLDEIGEYRYTYVVPAAGSRNSDLTCTGLFGDEANKTWEDTDGKKVTDSGIDTDSKTEKFVNFGDGTTYDTSNYRIKYVLTYDLANNKEYQDLVDNHDGHSNCTVTLYADNAPTTPITGTTPSIDKDHFATVEHVFKPKTTISATEMKVIESIFNDADTDGNDKDEANREFVKGEVYVGTQSYKDISDTISYDEFVETYIKTNENAIDVKQNDKGNWLKVIDNNNDGVAEYVFKVVYTIAQVSKVKDDAYTLDVKNHTLWNEDVSPYEECDIDDLNTLTSQKVVANGDMETGTVVYYAIIDGKAQAYPTTVVPSVNIDKYVRKTETVTTTDGDDYIKSDVCEHIEDEAYDAAPERLAGKVNYDLFLVRGDYLGAFVKSEITSDYKLITDGWFDSRKNADEYAVRVYDEESERADKQEIVDITTNGDLFIDRDVWNVDHTVDNNDWGALKYLGGVDKYTGARNDLPANVNGTFKHTCADPGESKVIDGAALNGGKILCENDNGDISHYFFKNRTSYNVIKTTVAAITADGTILPVENSSVTGRYRHDMIDLTDLSKVPTRAAVDGEVYRTSIGSNTAYDARLESTPGTAVPVTVRATSSTVYYVVYPASTDSGVMVTKSVGYSNAPDVKAWNEKGWVEDIYAVGTLRTADNDIDVGNEYTADVVVVELNNYENGKEIVLVLDDAVKLSDTRYRELVVITADGKLETRTINWRNSFLAYDGDSSVNTKWVEPGLYYMTTTSEKDVYALQGQLNHDDIADEGGYTTGRVERVRWTNDRYVVIDPYFWSGSSALGGTRDGEDQFDLTAETPLFRVSYDDPDRYDNYGTANVDEGVGADWDDDFLSATLDRANDNYPKVDLVRDTRDKNLHNDRYYNYNRVLIHHDGKGNVVYAVSFDKLADESGINSGNYTDVDMYNYAMTVWNNVKPATAKNTDVVISFNLNLTGDDKITVMKNAEDTEGVEYDAGDDVAEIAVPKAVADKGVIRFCILEDENTTLAAVVPNNADWSTTQMKRDPANPKLWNIVLTHKDAGLLALSDDATATIWTVDAVEAKIAELQTVIDKEANELTPDDIAKLDELTALLTEIQENKVEDYEGVQDTIDSISDKVDEAEAGAAEDLKDAKNEALTAINGALSVAEPYWANDPMGWKALTAEIDAIKAEIESAEDIETVTAKKAEALSKITVPATLDVEEVLGDSNGALPLFTKTVGVDVTGVPAEKKLVLSTKTAPAGYTKEDILADDDLIKALLSWNDSVGETAMTGNGTAESPWKCGNDGVEGRQYVKSESDATDGKIWVNTFLSEKLGKFFPNEGKVIFVLLDMEAAGIEDGVTLLQPINTTMLGADKCFETGAYGSDVKITVDCSGIQWGE